MANKDIYNCLKLKRTNILTAAWHSVSVWHSYLQREFMSFLEINLRQFISFAIIAHS